MWSDACISLGGQEMYMRVCMFCVRASRAVRACFFFSLTVAKELRNKRSRCSHLLCGATNARSGREFAGAPWFAVTSLQPGRRPRAPVRPVVLVARVGPRLRVVEHRRHAPLASLLVVAQHHGAVFRVVVLHEDREEQLAARLGFVARLVDVRLGCHTVWQLAVQPALEPPAQPAIDVLMLLYV